MCCARTSPVPCGSPKQSLPIASLSFPALTNTRPGADLKQNIAQLPKNPPPRVVFLRLPPRRDEQSLVLADKKEHDPLMWL